MSRGKSNAAVGAGDHRQLARLTWNVRRCPFFHSDKVYAARGWNVSPTITPALPSIAISVSMLNSSSFPLIRSLMRGCVTPNSLAALACVSFRCSMSRSIEIISPARSRRLRASSGGKPTSSKTFPEDGVIRSSGIVVLQLFGLPLAENFREPAARDFDITAFRFARPFFECVKDINRLLVLGNIN